MSLRTLMTSVVAKPNKVAIIGSGLIGRQWAMIFAAAGVRVILYDVNSEKLRDAVPAIEHQLCKLAVSGHLRGADGLTNESSREAFVRSQLAQITTASDLDAALFPHACLFPSASHAAPVDYVQECVPERLDVKRELFAYVDRLLTARLGTKGAAPTVGDGEGEGASATATTARLPIIASSSGAFATFASCDHLTFRRRALLAHLVSLPYDTPSVEVVPAPFTEAGVAEQTAAWLRAVGQQPVLVRREQPGTMCDVSDSSSAASLWSSANRHSVISPATSASAAQ